MTSSAKPPIPPFLLVGALVLLALAAFILGVTGVSKGIALALTGLVVVVAVALIVPRMSRRR